MLEYNLTKKTIHDQFQAGTTKTSFGGLYLSSRLVMGNTKQRREQYHDFRENEAHNLKPLMAEIDQHL